MIPSGSIWKKLFLLVFLSVLPALAIIVHSGLERQRQALGQAETEAMKVAHEAAMIQDRLTAETRQLLSTLAHMPEVEALDGPASDRLFRSVLEHNPVYVNIHAVDAEGMLFASALPAGKVSLSDRRHFKEAKRSMDFSAGEYIVSRVAFEPAFPFSYPIRDAKGGFAGIVIAAVSLKRYGMLFEKADLPPGSFMGIVDHAGLRLFRAPESEGIFALGKPIVAEVWQAVSGERERGASTHRTADGLRRIVAWERLRLTPGASPYMFIMVGLPETGVLERARGVMVRDVGLLALAAALTFFTAWFVGNKVIVAKLRGLTETADRLSRGDLSARSGLAHDDGELGQLAASFDSMAQTLTGELEGRRRAERDIREARDFLDKIINTIADPIFVSTRERGLVLVNDALCAFVGRPREDILGRTEMDFFPPDVAAGLMARNERVLETGVEDLSEERLPAVPDGTRTVLTLKSRYLDDSGEAFLVGVTRDISERKRFEERLTNSLAEKEVLLREVHHRVKNNLQVISSLLYLQAETAGNPEAAVLLADSRGRVASMALVHEELYRSEDLSRVGLRDYVDKLVSRLMDAWRDGRNIVCATDVIPVLVPVDKAVPFGLALNELVTNAIKHAFAGREAGRVEVRVTEADGWITAEVADDGVGLPADFSMDSERTLGMRLVTSLAGQLRGHVRFGTKPRTAFFLEFPL